jgi:hypothetical protein
MNRLTAIMTCLTILAVSTLAVACPNCRDTIADTAASDGQGLPAAFNYSIYMMLLAVFGVAGFVVRTIVKGVRSTPV